MKTKIALILLTGLLISGCSTTKRSGETTTVVLRESVNELEREPAPGTVHDVWIEPMYDTVRVPGQIDPAGVYYRKGHNTLMEVRYGRYQKVEFPNDKEPTLPKE